MFLLAQYCLANYFQAQYYKPSVPRTTQLLTHHSAWQQTSINTLAYLWVQISLTLLQSFTVHSTELALGLSLAFVPCVPVRDSLVNSSNGDQRNVRYCLVIDLQTQERYSTVFTEKYCRHGWVGISSHDSETKVTAAE